VLRFRWVALQLDSVSRCRSLNALRHALSSLPRSLDETYRRILDSIEAEEQPHVRRILQWILFSKRPLQIEEIVVIYQIGDKIHPPLELDDEHFYPEGILDIFRGLLSFTLHQTTGPVDVPLLSFANEWDTFPESTTLQIVELAHYSVKEYLLSSSSGIWTINQELTHIAILKSAIAYYLHFMALDDIHSSQLNDLTLKYPLAQYFVDHVFSHLWSVPEHLDLLPSFHLLLHPPSIPFANRLGWRLVDKYGTGHPSHFEPRNPAAVNLLLAIRLGLPRICQSLLALNVNLHPNLASPILRQGRPALVEAAVRGNPKIVRLLLDVRAAGRCHGADPLADGSALEWAVSRGDTQVVQMLLEAGADMKDASGRFGRSLIHAIRFNHKEIVLLLLNAGADVNAYEGKILATASVEGREELVRILVAAGAHVDAGNGRAVRGASYMGRIGAVRLLIEAGADVHLTGSQGDTAIGDALSRRHTKVVQLLLDAGAKYPAKVVYDKFGAGMEVPRNEV
jgi:hypothetical protein